MRDACKVAVETVIGRPLDAQQAKGIEDRVRKHQTLLARRDPVAWRSMDPDARMVAGAQAAAKELVFEAQKYKERLEAMVAARQRLEGYVDAQIVNGRDREYMTALVRTLVPRNDFKNAGPNAETSGKAIFGNAIRDLEAKFEGLMPGLWRAVPWFDDQINRRFSAALAGQTAGIDPKLVGLAQAVKDIREQIKARFNAAGGMIGTLENYDQAHAWSARLAQERRGSFVDDFLAGLDRSKYVHEDGRPYSEAELRTFLAEARLTIASDGLNKANETEAFGSMLANRGRRHREIHLKPESTADLLQQYSETNVFAATLMQMRQMATDTALIEMFGPNPRAQVQALARKYQAMDAREKFGEGPLTHEMRKLRVTRERYILDLFDELAGVGGPPTIRPLSDTIAGLRSLQVASKLGGAAISSIPDEATLAMTALANRLNLFKLWGNGFYVLRSRQARRMAQRFGIISEILTANSQSYANHNMTAAGFMGKLGQTVLHASGLNYVTNTRRIAFGLTMMDAIGHVTRRYDRADAVRADDLPIIQRAGVDQATWEIWRSAKLERFGANAKLLSPEAIMAVPGVDGAAKRAAAERLLAIIVEERDVAVVEPGARERVQLMGSPQDRRTVHGELRSTMMQFKSFPWAVIQRHWERASGLGLREGWVAYAAPMLLTMTLGGVLSLWLKDLLAGRDPRPMLPTSDDPKVNSQARANLLQAALSGGALGIYGDLALNGANDYGKGLEDVVAGPTFSTLNDLRQLVVDQGVGYANIDRAEEGADEAWQQRTGQVATRALRSNTPFANLWYTKALTDRAIWHQLNEALDPGYAERAQQRAYSNRRTTYWYGIDGLGAEMRAPDWDAGVGQVEETPEQMQRRERSRRARETRRRREAEDAEARSEE